MLYNALILGEGDDHVGRNWRRRAFTCTRLVPLEESVSLHELMRDILGPVMHG